MIKFTEQVSIPRRAFENLSTMETFLVKACTVMAAKKMYLTKSVVNTSGLGGNLIFESKRTPDDRLDFSIGDFQFVLAHETFQVSPNSGPDGNLYEGMKSVSLAELPNFRQRPIYIDERQSLLLFSCKTRAKQVASV